MKPFIRAGLAGAMISFLGSLPPGVMNLAATEITERKGPFATANYLLGFALVESLIVALVLWLLHHWLRQDRLLRWLKWLAIVFIGGLGFAFLFTKNPGPAQSGGNWLFAFSPFMMGMLLSAINPIHLPFWLGWTIVLKNKGWLPNQTSSHLSFITGIAIGTVIGCYCFVSASHWVIGFFELNQSVINTIVASIFLLAAAIQVKKMLGSTRELAVPIKNNRHA